LLAGSILGIFFFGGLWWTVQKITGGEKPYLYSALSFALRTSVILISFYFLLQAGWQYLLVALAGFIATRTFLAYKISPERRNNRDDH
jgi:F1F0 ATPase subunit 2